MEKLTPAKRLKQLRAKGWLEFVEFMESRDLHPRDLRNGVGIIAVEDFKKLKAASWMGDDLAYDMFKPTISKTSPGMIGLTEQVTPKPTKKNKMVRRGQYS